MPTRRGFIAVIVTLSAAVALAVVTRTGVGFQMNPSGDPVPPASMVTAPVIVLEVYLGLTAEQVSKLRDIQNAYHSSLAKVTEDYLADPKDRDAYEARSRQMADKANASMQAVLTDQQRQQAPAILEGLSSLRMLNLPARAAAELKLTQQQTDELAVLTQQMREKLLSLPPDKRVTTAGFQVIKQANDQAEALLSPAQKAILDKYNPKPESGDVGAVRCADLGGKPVLRKNDDGNTVGICEFPNGRECEQKALVSGDCSPDSK
jgi:putative hemolysin